MRRHCRIVYLFIVFVLPLSSCQCGDTIEYGWELSEGPADTADLFFDADASDTEPVDVRDTSDVSDALDATDARDILDVADVRDVPPPDIDTWQPEEVLQVPCDPEAHNDRTSMVIDDNGTVWLGYHRYDSADCSDPTLVVSRNRLDGQWVREDIQPHRGIFGLGSIEPDRPVLVYPDRRDGTFKAAHRRGDRDWEFHSFDVGGQRVAQGDGFDLTEDGERFFVTFAADRAERVRLYSYDTTDANPSWRTRRSLWEPDPRAAMERGLRADTDDSVYLVHENEDGVYGVARYDKHDDIWSERQYLDDSDRDAYVHSFVIRDDFELCMSARTNDGRLLVTCGTMFDLQRERKKFDDQPIPRGFPSSMVEGKDGTLYVVFHPRDHSDLRVAKRDSSGDWSVQTVYDQFTYGISTAIDKSGHLVLAFYTCEQANDQCSLKVIRERPDALLD